MLGSTHLDDVIGAGGVGEEAGAHDADVHRGADVGEVRVRVDEEDVRRLPGAQGRATTTPEEGERIGQESAVRRFPTHDPVRVRVRSTEFGIQVGRNSCETPSQTGDVTDDGGNLQRTCS